jgi:hypothetical protein
MIHHRQLILFTHRFSRSILLKIGFLHETYTLFDKHCFPDTTIISAFCDQQQSKVTQDNIASQCGAVCLLRAISYMELPRPSPQIGIKATIQSETNRCDPNWLWQGRRRGRQQQIEDILIIK